MYLDFLVFIIKTLLTLSPFENFPKLQKDFWNTFTWEWNNWKTCRYRNIDLLRSWAEDQLDIPVPETKQHIQCQFSLLNRALKKILKLINCKVFIITTFPVPLLWFCLIMQQLALCMEWKKVKKNVNEINDWIKYRI